MKDKSPRKPLTKFLLVLQAIVIIGLIFWLIQESQYNSFMQSWLSTYFPAGLTLLNPWGVVALGAALTFAIAYVSRLARHRQGMNSEIRARGLCSSQGATGESAKSPPNASPFYETMDMSQILLSIALTTQAISLWFITAAEFKISYFPANSYYYLTSLPIVYWWGLGATLAMIMLPIFTKGRPRTLFELTGLVLLALYLIGLPSFSYQNPRFLDGYYHTGNSLELVNSLGWWTSTNWYGHQFPGAFAYIGQLSTVLGIDPFQVMKYFPAGLSIIVVFFAYVIARMFSPNHAATGSGLILGGLWFQLHVSPQAFELPLYLGFVFVLVKAVEDTARRKLWTTISLAVIPVFIASHPETPVAMGLGMAMFLVLSLTLGHTRSQAVVRIASPLGVLSLLGGLWWSFIAVDARRLVQTSIIDRAIKSLSQFSTGVSPQSIPATPAPSYAMTILLEQVTSIIVWVGGLLLLLSIGRFRARERLLYGLFLASVATIPIAVFARADVLQRSYLFALFPLSILLAWLLERREVLAIRSVSLNRPFKVGLVACLILFTAITPVTRYGVDPFQYIPNSALTTANIAAGLSTHSILFLHPEEDGWRFYAALNGEDSAPKLEQGSLLNKVGGYVKPNSDPTLLPFNITYLCYVQGGQTVGDCTADYVVLTDFYVNAYKLRFGQASGTYLDSRRSFEGNLTLNFNLVYSTGLDRLYVNRDVS